MTGRTPDGARFRLVVAVPTFRRVADIVELAPLVAAQVREVAAGHGWSGAVLVIDNDPQAGAASALGDEAASDVRCVVETRPGISAARNRALDESRDATLLAFLDDDERPAPGWLAALVDTHLATGAHGVAGRVVSRFDAPLDPWIEAGGFFARRHRVDVPTGARIPVAATNNLLLDLREVRRQGLRFDDRFGLTGGEDSLFTRRLTLGGGALVWCAGAVVTEAVPASRVTRRWVLLRSVSSGNSEARVAVALSPGPARIPTRVRYLVLGLARALGGGLRTAAGRLTGSARHDARGRRAVARGLGMIGGALGWGYREYRRDASRPAPAAAVTLRRAS